MQVMSFGRMAILTDPTGAVFGLWEPATHNGWQVVDEPGAPAWSELMTHDQPSAVTFYSTLFGFTVEDMSSGGFRYASLHQEGVAAVGVGAYGESVDRAVPAAWTIYFAAADVDASVARVVEGGGAVVRAPRTHPTAGSHWSPGRSARSSRSSRPRRRPPEALSRAPRVGPAHGAARSTSEVVRTLSA
ncbi:VOC family protein [Cellulomonas soli]